MECSELKLKRNYWLAQQSVAALLGRRLLLENGDRQILDILFHWQEENRKRITFGYFDLKEQ